ncbi:MAG: hypothetical protein IPM92_09700 [Saprospiraceae bacterium]|nr:hypothetical protein [Saprospiraceae bacterium]
MRSVSQGHALGSCKFAQIMHRFNKFRVHELSAQICENADNHRMQALCYLRRYR